MDDLNNKLLWKTRFQWGPFIYYVSTCREGWSEIANFCLFSVLKTCLRWKVGGPKILKMCLHTIWMVPYCTSENGKSRNSSVFITSLKFCNANLWDLLCSSLQAWVSEKMHKFPGISISGGSSIMFINFHSKA